MSTKDTHNTTKESKEKDPKEESVQDIVSHEGGGDGGGGANNRGHHPGGGGGVSARAAPPPPPPPPPVGVVDGTEATERPPPPEEEEARGSGDASASSARPSATPHARRTRRPDHLKSILSSQRQLQPGGGTTTTTTTTRRSIATGSVVQQPKQQQDLEIGSNQSQSPSSLSSPVVVPATISEDEEQQTEEVVEVDDQGVVTASTSFIGTGKGTGRRTGGSGGGSVPDEGRVIPTDTQESLVYHKRPDLATALERQSRMLRRISEAHHWSHEFRVEAGGGEAAAALPARGTAKTFADEVRVTLEDVSYYIPDLLDAPSKRTVVNQSICYFTYEFFRRFTSYIRDNNSNSNNPSDSNNNNNNNNSNNTGRASAGDNGSDGNDEEDPGNGDGTGRKKKKKKKKTYSVRYFSDLFVPFTKKAVLKRADLCFLPGRTYLVLGPPESGKTSLLKAIAGRLPDHHHLVSGEPVKDKPHIEGRIAFNGVSKKDDEKMVLPNIVSFVGQLDIHAPYLTVKETFDFAYQCRKHDEMMSQDGDNGENLTIQGLGLDHVADTFVGNTNVRGVSGGQRRRVTLGEAMQGQLPVACADEISTGLDAAVTYDICKSIVDFSKAAMTTRIVSLLQPGPETFALFDEVVLLSEGYVVFAGPIEEVIDYFESLGYFLPATMDVADFLQSVTTADGTMLFDKEQSPYEEHLTSEQFADAFKSSKQYEVIQDRIRGPIPPDHDWKKSKVPPRIRKTMMHSWWVSCKLNFSRLLLLWWRDKAFIYGKIFENAGMAVATGGILWGKAKLPASLDYDGTWTSSEATALQSIVDGVFAALFMTCLHLLLGTTTSAPDDLDDRPIHYKHADANFYHTSAYVVGKLASTLPQRAIEVLAFSTPVYWMVGLDPTARSFFLFLAVLVTYTFSLKVLYGIIAQIFPNKQNVLSFGTFLVLLFSLFSGFIVYPSTIPFYYTWLYYVNPMAWAFRAMLIIELSSQKYTNHPLGGVGYNLMINRGFGSNPSFIGYAFAFFVPYIIVLGAILAVVLRKFRIEPIKAGAGQGFVAPFEVKKDDFNFPFTPVDLTFEDICYTVKSSTNNDRIQLLNNVCGIFKAGRMCALMGSSGAGKTTLMDVIALRKTSGVITGDVRLNGFKQERASFLRSSGYVEQFDVQQGELTVHETIMFCARLRLSRDNPHTDTAEGRQKFVDFVMDTMELTNIKDLQVGNYEEGGLSFEQRKRLAIAVELAASPSIIFLDEPTSGLDARGALIIMRAMKRIANTGRTICATIHQPSSAVFEMFDDLLLLKRGGEIVFFGELGEESCHLVKYFEDRGSAPIHHGENPAAWMLRAYTREGDQTNWKDLFEQSEQFRTMKADLLLVKDNQDPQNKITVMGTFPSTANTRFHAMIIRAFRIMMRSPSYNLARLMIAILYSLIIGSIFIISPTRKSETFTANEVDGILATIFQGLTTLGVVSVSMSVPVMKQIRDVFYKHRASGMLGHNVVTVAVTLAEIPYMALVSAIFSAVYYSLTGLFVSADKWFWFFFFFGLNVAMYTYFGQAFICMVRDVNTAGALVGALIGFNIFFSGLVVRPQYFVGIFQLGFWTAPGRFVYEGIIVTQFIGLQNPVIPVPDSPYWFNLGCGNYTNAEDCVGTLENYVGFYFGGKFTKSHLPIDLGVIFFCLFLARFALWLSLWKLNYVNT